MLFVGEQELNASLKRSFSSWVMDSLMSMEGCLE
jgi:hypothetical protein